MKKLTVLSMITAALLLTACGDSATGTEAKAKTETKTEAPMKCGEGKCGDETKKDTAAKCGADKKPAATEAKAAAKCGSDKKSVATEAKETVTNAVEKATTAVKEKASSAVESVKDTASSAVDSVKSAAASATAAVKSAVNTDAGKALYAKCAGCHGADGKNKALGKANPLAGQSAADIATKIAGYKAGTLNSVGMGSLMKGQVASMSDEDIKAVAAYIASL